jgi:hypothetical protein
MSLLGSGVRWALTVIQPKIENQHFFLIKFANIQMLNENTTFSNSCKKVFIGLIQVFLFVSRRLLDPCASTSSRRPP